MKIDQEQARQAGKLHNQLSYTDEELKLVHNATKIVFAFLSELGPRWDLAVSPLRQDLITLEKFIENRKQSNGR